MYLVMTPVLTANNIWLRCRMRKIQRCIGCKMQQEEELLTSLLIIVSVLINNHKLFV